MLTLHVATGTANEPKGFGISLGQLQVNKSLLGYFIYVQVSALVPATLLPPPPTRSACVQTDLPEKPSPFWATEHKLFLFLGRNTCQMLLSWAGRLAW